ncbi:hypothetical protein EEB11_18365 [Pseudotabrizicola sediminis]|uniref:Transferrin-binding protein B C-lobe/N-lobe beta barrel domain-containing protein n=1 Tax=Pseudotabrizicola sediminis TaxID=2486418 RepID=A0ABY2KGV8_9RHOB|nr:hypothetical protein [Pseudotabrizicola sediminis]TGD41484.1 hypothetical protein EEB11_18365 [Pseudotabrizicola sediminis]
MLYKLKKISTAALLVSVLALSACGSSGSSGGGGFAPLPEPDGEPTGNVEAGVQATYSGKMQATFAEGADVAHVEGDLTLDIDTDRDDQIISSATGFSAILTEDGQTERFDLAGSLGGTGSVDTTAGTLSFGLAGGLNPVGDTSDVIMVDLGGTGTFYGADAEQVSGTLTGLIQGDGSDGSVSGTGNFLLLQQPEL